MQELMRRHMHDLAAGGGVATPGEESEKGREGEADALPYSPPPAPPAGDTAGDTAGDAAGDTANRTPTGERGGRGAPLAALPAVHAHTTAPRAL